MMIYEPKGKAREYSPYALNYFKGCDHGCKYCYVPVMKGKYDSGYDHSNVTCDIKGYEKEIERFANSINRDKQVLLSFTGDPYCNAENGETREILQKMAECNLHVAILTKNPGKAMRDNDIMARMKHFQIGTTLTCDNDEDSARIEPGAPSPSKRMEAIKVFNADGIRTWISFEPIISAEQTLNMIEEMALHVHHIKAGKLNYHSMSNVKNWCDVAKQIVSKCRSLNLPFYIKEELAKYYKDIANPLSKNETDYDNFNV